MLPFWANDTIVRNRPTVTDDGHGNTIPNWAVTADLPIRGCSVQAGASQEILGGRDASLTQWTVYAPAGADVTATDGVTWNGDLYAVNGQPMPQRSPTGALNHTVIELRRIQG